MLNTEQILSVYAKLEKSCRNWSTPTWHEGLQEISIKALDTDFEDETACRKFLSKGARQYEIDVQRRHSNFCGKVFDSVKAELLDNDGTTIFHIKSEASNKLTVRQIEILDYVLSGYKAVEIADLLSCSKAAISQQLKKIVAVLRDYDLVDGIELLSYPVGKVGYTEDEMIYFIDRSLEQEQEKAA